MDIRTRTATRPSTDRRPARPARRIGVVRVIGAVLMFAAWLAACSHSPSGPAVASRPPDASGGSSATAGASTASGPLAFAQCMRAHGIADFPDPDPNGNFALNQEGDLDPADPDYQAATRACQSYGSSGKSSAPALSPDQIAATLRFAQCMRAHGVANYPDPDSAGHIPGVRRLGVDPNSPQFQTADDACKHYLVGVPGSS
jgi:hypothetical protein